MNMYAQSKITRKDEYKIVELYKSGCSSSEIARVYGYKTRNSVLSKLQKLNIKRRDCNEIRSANKSYNDFSMKEVDSEVKAYFLGLLLTDGYISEERGYIGLELTDKDVIDFLAEYLKAEYTTILPKGKAKLIKYRIVLYGRGLLSDVKRLGVICNKTYDIKGPELFDDENKFLSYIFRGIIDGDGWIRKDGKEFFICSASVDFIKWCKEAMRKIGFRDLKITFINNEFNGIYLLRTGVKYNIRILKEKVYDKPFGMMRKYDKLYKKDVQRL